jgi:hypothetical protein
MVTSASAIYAGVPLMEGQFVVANASGTALPISPGDYVAWSGNYIIAAEDALGGWKASGLGIALDRNPARDWAGREVVNSALLVARYGVFLVSASFSGKPLYGTLAYPVTTGSAVNGVSGTTGVGSTWNTAAPSTTLPQAITYDYKDIASAISAYVAGTATGSALLPGSGLLSAKAVSALNSGVAQVVGWNDDGANAGTGQLYIALWDRNADYY